MNSISNSSSIRTLFMMLACQIKVTFDTLKKDFSFQYKDEDLDIGSNDTLKNKK